MFQVFEAFQMYVAIVSEACCKRIFRVFQRYVSSVFFGRMLQVCLSRYCICFTQTLHVFYLDVVYGCNGFQVFWVLFSSVSTAFRRMLQLLYLDVSKVDRVLHLSAHPLPHRLAGRASYDTVSGSFRIGQCRPHVEGETKCSVRASIRR